MMTQRWLRRCRRSGRLLAVALAALAGFSEPSAAAGFNRPTIPAAVDWQWERGPRLPDPLGVAGAYAGVASGQLLVAGGANFPNQMPWEGGKKVWHDTVHALAKPGGKWRVAGKLPRPLGYGVSVTVGKGVVCIGGSDAERHYPDCFQLLLAKGQLRIQPLPALPVPLANAAGAAIGEMVYVCGGSDRPGELSALDRLFALDLSAPHPAWRELARCPGRPRILPVAAAGQGAFYLFGGADLVMIAGKPVREYLSDAWRYEAAAGWQRLARLPKPVAAAPSPAPLAGETIFIMGGDDGSRAGFQPVAEHPGFPDDILAYDLRSDQWRRAGQTPAPRATVPVVFWRDRYVIPSGEVRPGVRSPEVWTAKNRRK